MEKRETAHWLERGTESCAVCHQRYTYELEYRCYDCDSPICPVCVVTVHKHGRGYCPGCTPDDLPEAS